jgi:hypothetical protein
MKQLNFKKIYIDSITNSNIDKNESLYYVNITNV